MALQESCITEGYLVFEAMFYMIEYMQKIDSYMKHL